MSYLMFVFCNKPFVEHTAVKTRPLAGGYICFLGKGKHPVHIYGVFGRGITPIDTFGTYKDDFITLDRKTLYLAWLRVNNKDETSHCKETNEGRVG